MAREKTVAVVGQGYVGLPLAIAAVSAGWKVYGIDVDLSKINSLLEGRSYIEDISSENVQKALSDGFKPTSDHSVIKEASIVVICVPTPIDDTATPNLQGLISAVEKIGEFASSGTLVINESTSFPTTVRNLIPSTIKGISPELTLLFAVAPERVDPGNKDWSYRKTPRLVAGLTVEATKKAVSFYSTFCDNVVEVAQPEIAEFSKVLENSFRQVNIALVNELAPLARSIGVSIFDVIEAASTKPYGYMPFRPGVGVGGHCIPVDPMYLSWFARGRGIDLKMIESAQVINLNQPALVAQIAFDQGLEKNAKILVIGLAYKAGSKDLRESPSLELLKVLAGKFSNLEWWDESIESWNGTSRSKLSHAFDLVIVTHPIISSEILQILNSSNKVVDCTGKLKGFRNVISI